MHGINSQYLACAMKKSCCDSYTMLQKNVRRELGHLDQSVGSQIGILIYMDCVRGPESKPQSIDMFSQFRFYKSQDYS